MNKSVKITSHIQKKGDVTVGHIRIVTSKGSQNIPTVLFSDKQSKEIQSIIDRLRD